jgi:dipeptidyl aminopeptidase/acylaminoacyl peptidase
LLDSAVRNKVFRSTIQPNWQASGDGFWYVNYLGDRAKEYFYVDANRGRKQPAFSTEKLAAALRKASGKAVTAADFPFTNFSLSRDAKTATIEMNGQWWQVNMSNYRLSSITQPTRDSTMNTNFRRGGGGGFGRFSRYSSRAVSPDKKSIIFIKDYNVFLQPADSSTTAVALTTDGTKERPYGQLIWSPDSKYAVGYKMKIVEIAETHRLLTSVPNTTRAQHITQPRYDQPGDELSSYEMFLFRADEKKAVKADLETIKYPGTPNLTWRGNDARYFSFRMVDRGHQRFRIMEIDATTATPRTIVDEKTKTFIYEQRAITNFLPATNEVIWVSEKDGWRHIYLVDLVAGGVKNQVTKGEWVVRDIDSIDEKKREIWFSASGMNPGQDPYFRHYYRIGFDGSNLVKLTEADGNHIISYSPDKRFYLDTWSQVNIPPVTELRRTADGKKIMEVERADISALLKTGVKLPEVFVAKGRDGVTDIWGVVYRPSNFDPNKSYPVIENIYAGPQDAFVPKNFTPTGEMQSMAELGFIVVQIDGMGTANRSKAFHDVCWQNLADAGFPDRILWMKALAKKYPSVDISRVGLYGTSAGGQNSAGALLFHPEFYKAAVSACGCHDNRVDKRWWNEQWMGYPVGKHYEEQSNVTNAHKLQGNLLLIVGENDNNVPPESTYRVVDALIKANKDFDLLVVPGMGHSDGGSYGRKKKRDFFVKHLLGVDPPARNINELYTSTNPLSTPPTN